MILYRLGPPDVVKHYTFSCTFTKGSGWRRYFVTFGFGKTLLPIVKTGASWTYYSGKIACFVNGDYKELKASAFARSRTGRFSSLNFIALILLYCLLPWIVVFKFHVHLPEMSRRTECPSPFLYMQDLICRFFNTLSAAYSGDSKNSYQATSSIFGWQQKFLSDHIIRMDDGYLTIYEGFS